MKYEVRLKRKAIVTHVVQVEAENPEEAKKLAEKKVRNQFKGYSDETGPKRIRFLEANVTEISSDQEDRIYAK